VEALKDMASTRTEAAACRKSVGYVEKLIAFWVSKKIFMDAQRAYFLLSAFYGRFRHYDALYAALTQSALERTYMKLPRHIVVDEQAGGADVPTKRFARIHTAIRDLRNGFFVLERPK
jgi:hypothetical protein